MSLAAEAFDVWDLIGNILFVFAASQIRWYSFLFQVCFSLADSIIIYPFLNVYTLVIKYKIKNQVPVCLPVCKYVKSYRRAQGDLHFPERTKCLFKE